MGDGPINSSAGGGGVRVDSGSEVDRELGLRDLRVLWVTNMYPVPADPIRGIFVRREVEAVNRYLAHPVRVELVGRTGAGGLTRSRAAVARAIDEFKPDILHVYYGLSGIALPIRVKSAIILTLCGSDLLGFGKHRHPKRALEYFVSLVSSCRARAILLQSEVMREALPTPVLRARAIVLPSGIDPERFKPLNQADMRQRLGWDPTSFTILFPSSPRRSVKRYELATAAARLFADRDPSMRVEVRYLDGVPEDEVPWHINASDAVLITSEWEGGPIALAESLACGVPVVSVPVGYARDPKYHSSLLRVVAPRARALADALSGVAYERPSRCPPRPAPYVARDSYAQTLLHIYRRVALERKQFSSALKC